MCEITHCVRNVLHLVELFIKLTPLVTNMNSACVASNLFYKALEPSLKNSNFNLVILDPRFE